VQGDLAEINHEIRQLEQEIAVSDRVVVLAEEDLGRYETQVSSQIPIEAGSQLASVRLDGAVYTPDEAHTRLERIRATRAAYVNRSSDARHDLGYLTKQSARLEELLTRLQAEQTEFRVQVSGLNRQIDAIARNERLIGLLEKRNQTIEECSQYETVSLNQITSRLDQVKGKQEAALDLLASEERATDYEDIARSQIATEELRSPDSIVHALSGN
jgi:chromosome segregation ATPase